MSAVFTAGDELAEDAGEGVGGFAGDLDAVVPEDGFARLREEEGEGVRRVGEVAQEDTLDGTEEPGC